MKATMELENPRDLVATISVSMTLGQWMDLKAQMKDLPYHGGAQTLRAAITDLTMKACATFQYRPDDEVER